MDKFAKNTQMGNPSSNSPSSKRAEELLDVKHDSCLDVPAIPQSCSRDDIEEQLRATDDDSIPPSKREATIDTFLLPAILVKAEVIAAALHLRFPRAVRT